MVGRQRVRSTDGNTRRRVADIRGHVPSMLNFRQLGHWRPFTEACPRRVRGLGVNASRDGLKGIRESGNVDVVARPTSARLLVVTTNSM